MTSRAVREAKRTAITDNRLNCPNQKYCGQSIPGRRRPNQASSSPTAHAMYLSNTPSTGLTQSIRITPPSGYSNTVCCGDGSPGRDIPKIKPPVVAGGVSSGGQISHIQSSLYRGRGTLPKRNWQPSQLSSWRMSPAPNRMQRIGNVRPPPPAPIQQIVSKRQPTITASEHITSIKDKVVECIVSEDKKDNCTADTVISYNGFRKMTCKTTLHCDRPPQKKDFAGTGLQRYTTADIPLLIKCTPPSTNCKDKG